MRVVRLHERLVRTAMRQALPDTCLSNRRNLPSVMVNASINASRRASLRCGCGRKSTTCAITAAADRDACPVREGQAA